MNGGVGGGGKSLLYRTKKVGGKSWEFFRIRIVFLLFLRKEKQLLPRRKKGNRFVMLSLEEAMLL